jgi:streptogramin lyase
VNEVTTVAMAYALAGFAVDSTHVASGPSALSQAGLVNAFLNVNQLTYVNCGGLPAGIACGSARITTPGGQGTLNPTQLYTLADILAACVNSDGANNGPTNPTACYTLTTKARSNGTTGTAAKDTATAAINMAHNPASNVAALFALASSNPPFVGGPQPNDFTLGIVFTVAGLNSPQGAINGIAVDAQGSLWISNLYGPASSGGDYVIKLSSLGVPVTGSPFTNTNLSYPGGIAIDTSGGAWVANSGGVGLIHFSSDGSSTTQIGAAVIAVPSNVVIDKAGNLWSDNYSSLDEVTKITPNGSIYSTYTAGLSQSSALFGLAIDGGGNVWAVQNTSITKLHSDGTAYPNEPVFYTNTSIYGYGIGIDASGTAWVAEDEGAGGTTPDIVNLTISAASQSQTEYSGDGLLDATGIAIDGAGNVWVTNDNNGTGLGVSEFSNSGTGLSPKEFLGGGSNSPASIAIDGSGNVWTAAGDAATVSELIGAAVPVVTPIAAGLTAPYTPGSMP